MRKPKYRPNPNPQPSTPAPALTMADRQKLTDLAPTTPGDHLVSLQRDGQPEVFGVVRCDKVGRRLVAVALTADDATTKAKPAVDRRAPVDPSSGSQSEQTLDPQAAKAKQRTAEQTMQSELADYRREVARVTGQAAKLV